MKVTDYIIEFLIDKGVGDVFGYPGGVICHLMDSATKYRDKITPHLCSHEQGAAFAAVGYGQAAGVPGVAYSTRGPGFTNMMTAIADAYYDSVPAIFVTAHAARHTEPDMRVLNNQEIDVITPCRTFTKYAVRVDSPDDFIFEVNKAYGIAVSGRKGPVVLDIWNGIFSQEIIPSYEAAKDEPDWVMGDSNSSFAENDRLAEYIQDKLAEALRPVLLIGNGVRGGQNVSFIKEIAHTARIPVLSSRIGQDIVPDSDEYFGFVGSRATRYSNFILSKADLIISVGNRLSFPVNSQSFAPIVEKTDIVRVDIDDTEFKRELPRCSCFKADAGPVLEILAHRKLNYRHPDEWMEVCNSLKKTLDGYDKNSVIDGIMNLIGKANNDSPLVCDVGNHSFWVTTAYAYQKVCNRIMYSGSFGTLGSALPKAIGAYYSTGKPVLCFTGDQGVQFNIQELQLIGSEKLPVGIVILNNQSSGMIMERQKAKYGNHLVHTTLLDGYGYPDFEKLAGVYGVGYERYTDAGLAECSDRWKKGPVIIEVMIDKDTQLQPSLPQGMPCQDLYPYIERNLYAKLDAL